jgi:2-polyprenyl-3-methyl-5-hydroxy-6-metoxy-1,4-benzoquinol methylase
MKCICNLCGSEDSKLLAAIKAKPEGETVYLKEGTPYYREIRECNLCGVFYNCHEYDLFTRSFYEGEYNSAIDSAGLERRFNKIINLPSGESDNKGRVKRIADFLDKNEINKNAHVLDVGSGTGVFPYEMASLGYLVSAVDPDPVSVQHMKKHISLENTWQGSINDVPVHKFNLISFNKVLEHIEDPFELIDEAVKRLDENGFIYIELPFGEKLAEQGLASKRAEFFIEHFTTFTHKAFHYIADRAELSCTVMNDLVDPSGKHTIYGFFRPK